MRIKKTKTISEGNITLPENSKEMTYGEFVFLSNYIFNMNKWMSNRKYKKLFK